MQTRLRAFALKLHLWLGLTAGAVIALLCLTGVLLSFEAELTKLGHPERYEISTGVDAGTVPLSLVVDAVHETAPEATVGAITMYADGSRPWDVNLGRDGRAFVDPHTGRVIESGVRRAAFFQNTMELHRWLLADEVGRAIVGASTVAFVFILIFGIIIWWPKTKGALKARINPFSFFTKHSSGRRKLHDLHVALGIWCWPILLMVALTGLPEAYDWAGKALYTLTASERMTPPPSSTSDSTATALGIDSIAAIARRQFPDARILSLRFPQRGNGAVSVSAVAATERVDRHSDNAYLDRATGELLRLDRYGDLPTGARARRMVEPWHTGAAWGMPGKILIFLAVLFGATFPVTGFLMYRAGKGHAA